MFFTVWSCRTLHVSYVLYYRSTFTLILKRFFFFRGFGPLVWLQVAVFQDSRLMKSTISSANFLSMIHMELQLDENRPILTALLCLFSERNSALQRSQRFLMDKHPNFTWAAARITSNPGHVNSTVMLPRGWTKTNSLRLCVLGRSLKCYVLFR